MSVVDALRQNDPARTRFFHIRLREETSDLAQALEQNQFITDIGLDMREEQRTDWDSLLCVIATRANLEYVDLKDLPYAPTALVRSILRAMQQNTAIRTVELTWLQYVFPPIFLRLWTMHLQSHHSGFTNVTGNKEQEVSRQL